MLHKEQSTNDLTQLPMTRWYPHCLDCPWAGPENLGPGACPALPCPQGPGSGPGLAGLWLALKGQGPDGWQGPVQGQTRAGPGPQSIVGNTYKFINYTPNIYQIQIYLLNYISYYYIETKCMKTMSNRGLFLIFIILFW